VQSMPDVSPTKWHMGHTTWFFEAFIFENTLPGYVSPNDQYNYLFKSCYNAVGDPVDLLPDNRANLSVSFLG
jgi:hypothetical protein